MTPTVCSMFMTKSSIALPTTLQEKRSTDLWMLRSLFGLLTLGTSSSMNDLWYVANLFVYVAQSTRPAISTASATMAENPVSKPTTLLATDSSSRNDGEGAPLSSVEVGTLARILVALAIHHHNYQPSRSLTSEHGKQVKSGTYAPIYDICEELGFKRPSEWETVKKLLLKASNKIGMDEVNSAVSRHQALVRDRPQTM